MVLPELSEQMDWLKSHRSNWQLLSEDENEALNEIFSYTAYFLSELYPELHAQYLGGERDPIEVRKGVLNCLEAVAEQNEE